MDRAVGATPARVGERHEFPAVYVRGLAPDQVSHVGSMGCLLTRTPRPEPAPVPHPSTPKKTDPANGLRRCSACGVWKRAEEFSVRSRDPVLGRQTYCKPCHGERNRASQPPSLRERLRARNAASWDDRPPTAAD